MSDGWHRGRCRACGLQRTRRGHDPCIADLPGVAFACCGHGILRQTKLDGEPVLVDTCYVSFDDGDALYRNPARGAMRMLGGDPPDQPEADLPLATLRLGDILIGPR